jgi:RNA-directed DNA polymerase
MKRIRARIKALTGRGRPGMDIRDVTVAINPILRGWGNYFRTGNAAIKFVRIDRYVVSRLCRLMIKRYGRPLRPGQWRIWTREWFETHGLYRLRGTNALSGTRVVTTRKTIGEPCAGKPHARIERGMGKRA